MRPDFHEEVEDLGLDGDVKGAGGLVGIQDVGIDGEGAGHPHPLQLAAGQLMRVTREDLAVEANALEPADDLRDPSGLAPLDGACTGSPSDWRMVMRGSRERRGLWKTIWLWRRICREPECSQSFMSRPSNVRPRRVDAP